MDLMARINKLEEENKKLKNELNDLKTNYSALNNTIDGIKKDNGSQTFLIKGLDFTVTTLKTDLTTLQSNFNTHYHKIKGGFSAASADDYTLHLIRTSKTLHDDVETFKTTGAPLQ
jgi:predicted nuclease with TOPRIM domain